jgi:hypothetical protein
MRPSLAIIDIAGRASAVQQGFRAGLLDELMLDIVPVVLGTGESLVEDVDDSVLTPVEVIDSPHATHVCATAWAGLLQLGRTYHRVAGPARLAP